MSKSVAEVSHSALRFALWNTYDALIYAVCYQANLGGIDTAEYQLPILRELQDAVASFDGAEGMHDYYGTVTKMIAEVKEQAREKAERVTLADDYCKTHDLFDCPFAHAI